MQSPLAPLRPPIEHQALPQLALMLPPNTHIKRFSPHHCFLQALNMQSPPAPFPAYQASTTRSTAAPRFPPSAYLAAPIFCVAPQSPEIFHAPLKEYCRPVSKYLILAVNLVVIAVLNNPAGLFAYLPICGPSRTATPGFPLRSRACTL